MHRDLIDELSQPPHLILVRGRERIQCLAQRAYERGELVRPLAGVYAAADTAGLDALAVVVGTVHPDAVISGRAAAALTWWPELEASGLTAVARHRLASGDGISFAKGVVPPELIVESNGIRLTHPSLTVLDLVPELGGEAIDEALRRGVVTLDQLWEALALTPQRAGNKQRRWLLEDSRDVPWSPAERDLHRIYRGLDLSRRHRTNHRVDLPTRAAYIDLALPELRLGFEVDGYDHHSGPVEFRRDRTRDPELAELGWMVVRFDAIDVSDNADWVRDRLHGIIAGRAIDLGLT